MKKKQERFILIYDETTMIKDKKRHKTYTMETDEVELVKLLNTMDCLIECLREENTELNEEGMQLESFNKLSNEINQILVDQKERLVNENDKLKRSLKS